MSEQVGHCSDIAEYIFSKEPTLPGTIQLGMDETDHEYVFQTLLNILLEGLYVLFGSDFTMTDLTPELLQLLNQYMKSMGFIVNKHLDKEGHCYCDIAQKETGLDKRYVFLVNKHQLRKNQIIIRKNLTEYYVNIGQCQLHFAYL